ncbi:MAG: hypothetical protein FJY10_00335 [Bacteroidetes bacterium]|nr:hypothetical protein [Bacteroidota bacterium]
MSSQQHFFNIIVYALLKAGVILFIGGLFLEIVSQNLLGSTNPMNILNIALFVLFLALFILIAVLNRSNFDVFGFFIVFIASIFKVLFIIFVTHTFLQIPIYAFLSCISIYFMTKSKRNASKKKHFLYDL